MGRHLEYTEEVGDKICERLMEGESLRAICKSDDMPNRSTVHQWILKNKSFSDQYASAKMLQAENMFEETIDIADDKAGDPARDRLRVDTRKWFVGKVAPKIYGDKVEQEHTGEIKISWET